MERLFEDPEGFIAELQGSGEGNAPKTISGAFSVSGDD